MRQPIINLRADKTIKKTAIICLIGLGGFLVWGAAVPLAEGVSAAGKVVVDGDRKTVQHLEGGIIEEILVREGEIVNKGDKIVVLKNTASLANRDQVIQEYASLTASVERLQVLLADEGRPQFETLSSLELGPQEMNDIIERELELFDQQKSAANADLAVLQARRNAAQRTQKSLKKQIIIERKSLVVASEEEAVIAAMFEKQLARRDQLSRAERQKIDLEASIARLQADLETAAATERDLTAQIAQGKAQFSQDISSTLLETRAQLLASQERLNATQDVLDRAIITAPVTGEVLNMQFATVGGVVRPGETIMEIIPKAGAIRALVRIKPSNRASVFEGQTVRTQISAYKGWQAPRLDGRVIGVSADLKTDPATSAVYYEARVLIPAEELTRVSDIDIIPGMPVDVFIYSGRDRTMFDYLFEPLGESVLRGLRSS